jgi:prepilin-type N-terminal cleavage/methylation domain-containing protein
MRNQKGMTLLELVIVLAVALAAVAITGALSGPWIARESMRGAVGNVNSYLQLAKIEAVSRNHPCRFVVDTSAGTVEVWDTMGTGTLSDDTNLYLATLPSAVAFERPTSGAAVTLFQLGGSSRYHTVFTSDGIAAVGTGQVFLHGGDGYGTIRVHAAGGVDVAYWNGSAWRTGY